MIEPKNWLGAPSAQPADLGRAHGALRPRAQRALAPCRGAHNAVSQAHSRVAGAPLRRVVAWPGRVAGPGGRVVAVCRARTWPCCGLGCDTTHPQPTASLSQYTTVYRDTNSQHPDSSITIQPCVLRHNLSQSLKPSACHNTTECIVTRSSSPSLSCHNTLGVLDTTHQPFCTPKTCCITIQFSIVL